MMRVENREYVWARLMYLLSESSKALRETRDLYGYSEQEYGAFSAAVELHDSLRRIALGHAPLPKEVE